MIDQWVRRQTTLITVFQMMATHSGCHWVPATNSMKKIPQIFRHTRQDATFGAAALHITRLFYGVPSLDRNPDSLFNGLDFVSDEFNGKNQDNRGTVRPRHRRKFNNGLWRMIIENGQSRVYLGVHWVFDAFAVNDNNQIDLSRNVGEYRLVSK